MHIKQQKQIKRFLLEEFGKEKGRTLFDRQDKTLETGLSQSLCKPSN